MSESKHIYIVYKTTNLVNGKFYIGKHKQKFHFPILFDGYFGSGILLINAIKKYGKKNFIRETLHVFYTPEEAFAKEKEIVNEKFVNSKDTYNLMIGGLGITFHTEESKRKIGEYHKGKPSGMKGKKAWNKGISKTEDEKIVLSIKAKERLSNKESHPLFGKHHNDETKQKISEQSKLKWKDEEYRNKMKMLCVGRKHSEETKLKLSNANKGKQKSEETKQRMSIASKGKPKPKLICPHCGKIGGSGIMQRWHFNNCKFKKTHHS